MSGFAFSNSATLSRKRWWLAASVAGGRPLITRVTLPPSSVSSSPAPHAAVPKPSPTTSRSPRVVRIRCVPMGTDPFLGEVSFEKWWCHHAVFRVDDDTNTNR